MKRINETSAETGFDLSEKARRLVWWRADPVRPESVEEEAVSARREDALSVEVVVNDGMQKDYRYVRTCRMGEDFDPRFTPDLAPNEMLELGVFCGKYMTDCLDEFPGRWFKRARLADGPRDCSLNYFGVNASVPLSVWRSKGWIHPADPRGWFQWYCRYYSGRRMLEEDQRQIERWRAFRRHQAQVQKNCEPGNLLCRPRQRQALLQWAYDSRLL